MKWALLLIPIFGLPALAEETFTPETCSAELAQYALGESQSLPCNSIEIAKKVIEGEEGVVPEKIYHYGPQKYLFQNASAGTVPPEAWKEIVTGTGKYSAIRSGLYGTHNIDINRYNSSELLWDLNGQWLMEIHIKPECRSPEHVLSLKLLEQDPRFQSWLSRQHDAKMDLPYFTKNCRAGDWRRGFTGEDCAKIALRYMEEAQIKTVVDFNNPKAFYLRDRDCIASVRATRRQLLDSFITNPSLWIRSCDTAEGLLWVGDMFPYKLVRDVITGEKIDPPLTPEELRQLQQNARLLPGSWGYRRPMIDGIDELANCYGKIPEDQCRKQARAKMNFWGL